MTKRTILAVDTHNDRQNLQRVCPVYQPMTMKNCKKYKIKQYHGLSHHNKKINDRRRCSPATFESNVVLGHLPPPSTFLQVSLFVIHVISRLTVIQRQTTSMILPLASFVLMATSYITGSDWDTKRMLRKLGCQSGWWLLMPTYHRRWEGVCHGN